MRIIPGIVLALGLAAGAVAQTPEAAVRDVIREQLEAFSARDAARAFTFASPMIQNLFGGPGPFGTMVQQGYPMVWTPGAVTFQDLRAEDGRIQQRVVITGPDGVVHTLDYHMIPGADGWKINGVVIVRGAQIGV